MLAPIIRTPSGFISALAFIRGRGFLARGQISTTRVKLEKFSSAVLWGGWAPSTQDLLLEKLSPTPTTVQVTQLPCTNRTLYLDFSDLCDLFTKFYHYYIQKQSHLRLRT